MTLTPTVTDDTLKREIKIFAIAGIPKNKSHEFLYFKREEDFLFEIYVGNIKAFIVQISKMRDNLFTKTKFFHFPQIVLLLFF